MIYTWWTPPKKAMAITQRRIIPPRSNRSTNVSGTALSPAIAKAAISAQETITLRIVPKTMTIPSSQTSSGRMNKLALRNRQQTENQRMTITCFSPKTR